MAEAQRERQPLLAHEDVEVWPIIHMIRTDVMQYIDTPLTFEALTTPDSTYTLIRPLEEKYNAIQRAGNKSVVFCLLLNRVHFVRDQNLTTAPLSSTRAMLCEILAVRTLRDNGNSLLDMALALTTSWPVWSGADPHTIVHAKEETNDNLQERVGNAIEMAILSKAKRFIKSSPCQKVIDNIWIGKCVYQAESSHSILSDTYKRTPIHFYDPHKAPLLDHYRLKVPAVRSVLEYINFLVLFILFVVAIELNERDRLNIPEILFMIFALGFTLEKVAAMQEHGIKVYFKGTWNGFDLAFVTAYCIYASFRLYGVLNHHIWAKNVGVDFLAVIACLMFPRLAFVTLKNNLMVLSLRAMMMQFVALMMIAAFCFGGFFYALWTLSRKKAHYSSSTIAWWMLDLWFGLDASGFDRASEFDYVFGPILMVTYACLSNTLLLTVLVSILSNTFARINEDAAAETMFRRAVSTIEGVKADSLFSYQPPINLLALCVLLPSSYILSPRWFHKVNVFLIRASNFPVLLIIAWYERQAKKSGSEGLYDTLAAAADKMFHTLPRPLKRLTMFEGLAGGGADIDIIFELEDELDSTSALDTREYDDPPSLDPFRQGPSSKQSGHPPSSNGSSHLPPLAPTTSPRRPSTPSKLQIPSSPSQSIPNATNRLLSEPLTSAVPRRRVNSVLNRPDISQSYSPLAQVFQPLPFMLMSEDIPEGAPANLASYGPAGRRRLASMQSMHRRPITDFLHHNGSGHRRLQSMENDPRQESYSAVHLSESPDERQETVTADQIEGNNGPEGTPPWIGRLDSIEQRQKHIEDMLVQLTASVLNR